MTAGNGHALRVLPDWISAFVEYTEDLPSSTMFRRWAAVSTLAAAMERRCWVRSRMGVLFANTYHILVGPPASGKTVAIDAARDLLISVPGIRVAPGSMTHASLIDDLRKAARTFTYKGVVTPYHSLQIYCRELSLLLPEHETKILSHLINLYDCDDLFEESRRGREEQVFTLSNTQLNILAGTTPSYLGSFFPDGAWEQGFASRLLLIYCNSREWREPWGDVADMTKQREQLVHDLRMVSMLQGQFVWELTAQTAFRDWFHAGGPPIPDHPKLTFYVGRRHAILMKLCMAVCVSHSDAMIITLADYQEALGLLLDAEASIPDIFKAMSGGANANAIDNTYAFVWKMYHDSDKKPIRDDIIYSFIGQHTTTPTHSVVRLVELMVKSGLLEAVGLIGTRTLYRPLTRPR